MFPHFSHQGSHLGGQDLLVDIIWIFGICIYVHHYCIIFASFLRHYCIIIASLLRHLCIYILIRLDILYLSLSFIIYL